MSSIFDLTEKELAQRAKLERMLAGRPRKPIDLDDCCAPYYEEDRMTNEAEVFAARQASRKHQEWVERETVLGAKRFRLDDYPPESWDAELAWEATFHPEPSPHDAPPSDCWGYEVTPVTGVVL